MTRLCLLSPLQEFSQSQYAWQDCVCYFPCRSSPRASMTRLCLLFLLQEFSQSQYDKIVSGWTDKQRRCGRGEQRWGLFYAEKPTVWHQPRKLYIAILSMSCQWHNFKDTLSWTVASQYREPVFIVACIYHVYLSYCHHSIHYPLFTLYLEICSQIPYFVAICHIFVEMFHTCCHISPLLLLIFVM